MNWFRGCEGGERAKKEAALGIKRGLRGSSAARASGGDDNRHARQNRNAIIASSFRRLADARAAPIEICDAAEQRTSCFSLRSSVRSLSVILPRSALFFDY
jgi:hypothetical protein